MRGIVIYGPPGSGKGTQCEQLVRRFNFEHLSTGDLLRNEIRQQSRLGLDAQKYIDRGDLVPDQVIMGMIGEKMATLDSKGVLFDGIPRTVSQAKELDEILTRHGRGIDAIIALKVEDDELVRRLLERGKESGRADDANELTIKNRLAEYQTKTRSVANFYRETDRKIFEIDGQKPIETVSGLIASALDEVHTPRTPL